MKTIHKYNLQDADFNEVEMPINAEILSIQPQCGAIYLWAMIDVTETKTEKRYFESIGTGHEITNDENQTREYISTVQLVHGAIVLHIFEIKYN